MHTIQATVNERLLTKANRLFTGSLCGRIVEILQNARRAGATHVSITNSDGHVTVHDNGRGIGDADWPTLLDLGGSGWSDELDTREDPCGVGLFCLAPRTVTIHSRSKMAVIEDSGWRGTPVEVLADPEPVTGTSVCFEDEPWTLAEVEQHAVFSNMDVTVDGDACPKRDFVSNAAVHHPKLGCRIEVRHVNQLSQWHRTRDRYDGYRDSVLVNFHGHIVSFHLGKVSEPHLRYMVDLTDEPTGIRLMLPARTCLVENEALAELKNALEKEAFQNLARHGQHQLSYKEYRRARELGIDLPEAQPEFQYGLLFGESPEPIRIPVPEGLPLSACYQLDWNANDSCVGNSANAHLLSALGKFDKPFVPVFIPSRYSGYSWADLPMIEDVSLTIGKRRHREPVWIGLVTCVDSLVISVKTNDGKVYTSPVCMAMDPDEDDQVYVTPEAENRVSDSDVWSLLGGWHEEDDTYDTQKERFVEELGAFWANRVGPDEWMRRRILRVLKRVRPAWQRVEVMRNGRVVVDFEDGKRKQLDPPPDSQP